MNIHHTDKVLLAGVICSVLGFNAYSEDSQFNIALQNARNACSGISESMSDLKKMAGINTAITAVGTVAGGVALGTGIAKANIDEEANQIEEELQAEINELNRLAATQKDIDDVSILLTIAKNREAETEATESSTESSEIAKKQAELDELTEESKTLGNIRTGTMAGAAVADTVGTVIAINNRVDDNLQQRIDDCVVAIDVLGNERLRARVENTATAEELAVAEQITRECSDWKYVDISSINNRATGAAISGGAGAAMAIVGTITSASANSDSVRNDNSDDGKQKEQNLNTASNILAGGTTAASAVSTIFNATQISAIKKAVIVADKCEGALK